MTLALRTSVQNLIVVQARNGVCCGVVIGAITVFVLASFDASLNVPPMVVGFLMGATLASVMLLVAVSRSWGRH